MADDEATTVIVGRQEVVFKKKIKAGDKLTAADIKSINGSAPGEVLPKAVVKFMAGVAGN